MSPLFDGSRWDRLRRWGYYANGRRGRFTGGFTVALYAVPLPSVYLDIDEDPHDPRARALGVGVRLGNRGWTDDVVGVWGTVRLPPRVAAILERAIPSRP